MFTEAQLLPISALQHLIFCERQCALIHVEQLWAENAATVMGQQLHEKAHSGKTDHNANVRVARSLWLKSHQLGLIGQADVVEFHPDGKIVPVEYKLGKPKSDQCDEVQLCAQACCLEEMLDKTLSSGYLFYGKRQRRTEVQFDNALRTKTLETVTRLHEMIANRVTPTAKREPKCDSCSLLELCMPDSQRLATGAARWNHRTFETIKQSDGPKTDDQFSMF